jgi:hypothetical protein
MTTNDGEGFLGRWSRLKREAVRPPEETDAEVPAEAEAIDPATLPPIDTLDAASDYSRFLMKGVPRALQVQALRRAWTTDPAIAGYKSLADYDWDYNAPGYGALRVTDDVRRLVERVFGNGQEPEPKSEAVPEPEAVARTPEEPDPPEPMAEPLPEPVPDAPAAVLVEAEPDPPPIRRRRQGCATPRI